MHPGAWPRICAGVSHGSIHVGLVAAALVVAGAPWTTLVPSMTACVAAALLAAVPPWRTKRTIMASLIHVLWSPWTATIRVGRHRGHHVFRHVSSLVAAGTVLGAVCLTVAMSQGMDAFAIVVVLWTADTMAWGTFVGWWHTVAACAPAWNLLDGPRPIVPSPGPDDVGVARWVVEDVLDRGHAAWSTLADPDARVLRDGIVAATHAWRRRHPGAPMPVDIPASWLLRVAAAWSDQEPAADDGGIADTAASSRMR